MGHNSIPGFRTIWYRVVRYPLAAIFSILLVFFLSLLLFYLVGKVYPEFRLSDKFFAWTGFHHNAKYKFYTGPEGGAYYAIGDAAASDISEDGDSVTNQKTSGGSENAMRLTIEKKAFGLIQEDMINHDDELKKNVRIISPLYLERLHIFYKTNLFDSCQNFVQLSSKTDSTVLDCFIRKVHKINVGQVGSGTRIIASYVLALIDKQISECKIARTRYMQSDSGFLKECNLMCSEDTAQASDLVFYVGADPTDSVQKVLDSKRYKLMPISPSFLVTINREFDLGLRISDFKDKYGEDQNVSTIGTYALLITSKQTPNADVLRLVKSIDDKKDLIHHSLFHYKSSNISLPLDELGFYNSFEAEYNSIKKIEWKDVAAMVFSIVTLLFPVFKSVTSLRSKLRSWQLNKLVDKSVNALEKTGDLRYSTTLSNAHSEFLRLKTRVVDCYGDGQLAESYFKALQERLNMYLEKYPSQNGVSNNGKPPHNRKKIIPSSS